jgi:hypothetical protein
MEKRTIVFEAIMNPKLTIVDPEDRMATAAA